MDTTHELKIWLDCHGGRTPKDLVDGHIVYTTQSSNGLDEYEVVRVPKQEQLERFCDDLPYFARRYFKYK